MPTSVELFAGGGGMALGMQMAGFEHEQLVELSSSACDILRDNAKLKPELWKEENIREMDVRQWLKEVPRLGLPSEIDLIAGGPPCQPFSVSGKRAGMDDERDMFPTAVEAVRILRPRMFAFENVPGLLHTKIRPYYEYIRTYLGKPSVKPRKGESWEEHYRRLIDARDSGLRYHVFMQEMNAADFGVPQTRKRIFLIGFRSDVLDPDAWRPVPVTHSVESLLRSQWIDGDYWDYHGVRKPSTPPALKARVDALRRSIAKGVEFDSSSPLALNRWSTVRDARRRDGIRGLAELPEPVDYQENLQFANHWGIPNARIYKGHTGSYVDWPSKVLKAGSHGVCGGEAMIRYHYDVREVRNRLRYFTIREAARMQSFPDYYVLPGSRTAAMRALGNAVAVDVATAVGKHLLALTGAEASLDT
ncbi:DNA cytosine methyltransferase [Nocardia yamanashiensis]|uniref:DNA cytosine methyltransferase n=1 Tax=Nocardia yamanashiensis TaxID=209247 RepID=UPI000A04AFD4|nr:DNA (cytosine-5-)-methyltransferase [Nocardia yamanashiensis]